ncbi:MAG: DUF262 domain-containing protein [Alistipes sp.]|nr:DUF262 domain-containing protein [Alistipes sp.]
MSKNLPLCDYSINEIYCTNQKQYAIPIYQRNYAWGSVEIEALINDVKQAMDLRKEAYYIGTLVTYARANNEYEVIDGQQRLTTIYLILQALGVLCRSTLTYISRSVSASTLKNLEQTEGNVDKEIIEGYKIAKAAIGALDDENEFREYFCKNVHIIHYEVPQDVDLNHYFEVMNSRGEQLEMHEIVKSLLGGSLENDGDRAKFYQVWEACSEMGIYIQHKFPKSEVFGDALDNFVISEFANIPLQDAKAGKRSIKELMSQSIGEVDEKGVIDRNDQFQPIIDFPNFLLIVLKLTLTKGEWVDDASAKNCMLVDKELLNEFSGVLSLEKVKRNREEFARQFLFNLLKARYFLDNYVVHHEVDQNESAGRNPWKLQYYHKLKSGHDLKNLAGDTDVQEELVHLLSMFEVTFTPRQRKNYLFYAMMFLFDNFASGASDKSGLNNDYLAFLQKLAHKYFHDIYLNLDALTSNKQPKPDAFDGAILSGDTISVEIKNRRGCSDFRKVFEPGSYNVPLYVFNYTDYVLWKLYCEELRGKKFDSDRQERIDFFAKLGCGDFGLKVFDDFYFSRTRKSLEHFYPQAKLSEGVISHEELNCYGNFAMIGAEANSSGSNLDPQAKIKIYVDKKWSQISVASLKFKIMMQMCADKNWWGGDEISKHQECMLKILFPSSNA